MNNNNKNSALNKPAVIGSYGFKSKEDCDKWIEEKRNQYGFEWRVGFMVKFKSEQNQWYLVNKKGNEVKVF